MLLWALRYERNLNVNIISNFLSCFPTLVTEVAVETRGACAASADVVTESSIKAYAGVSAAVTIVTWQAFFRRGEINDAEGDLR